MSFSSVVILVRKCTVKHIFFVAFRDFNRLQNWHSIILTESQFNILQNLAQSS